ncbi:MAG: GumC family protein [Candidatus Acidiferrales bacterium]
MDEETKIQRYEPAARSLERRRSAVAAPYATVEMKHEHDLLAYWRVLQKRRWTVLTLFGVFLTLVVFWTVRQTPVYRATALLEIEQANQGIANLQELFTTGTDFYFETYLETQYNILQSTTLARRVIEKLRLDRLPEFNPPPGWAGRRKEKAQAAPQTFAVAGAGEDIDPETYQETLKNFYTRLNILPVKRSRLVEVSFESYDPELAARVANTLAASFIDQNLEARWAASQKATEWLSQQLLGLKSKLEKSEEELQAYARTHGLLFLESEQGASENIVNQRLRHLQDELTAAQANRYQKEALYQLVQAGNYEALPGITDNKLMQDLTVTLAQLKQEHALLSTTFTPDYYKVKQLQSQMDEIERVLTEERQRLGRSIVNDYQAALKREKLLRQAFEDQQHQAQQIAEVSVQYNILKREVDTNKQLYDGLLQRLKETGVSAGAKASNIRVVDSAEVPRRPARPRVFLNLALGVLLGASLGVGAAFVQEYLDNTLKTSEDVERFLNAPALALIPSVESLNNRGGRIYGYGVYGLSGRSKMLTGGDPKAPKTGTKTGTMLKPTGGGKSWYRIDREGQQFSALSEAFRSLRTSVLLSTAERPPRSLLISSSQPGEGKTTVSVNLAISLAQLGQRVLLIDGDMRRPCIHKAFNAKDSAGLVSYLTGQQEWRGIAHPTDVPGLDLLVCGPVPPNPAELLSSDRMRTLLQEAMAEYNFVVVDSPPLLSVADSRVLATLVEGVVLVVKGGDTPREVAQRAEGYALDVGANLIGIVLNNLDVRAGNYYYYRYYRYDYYGYGYRQDSKEKT